MRNAALFLLVGLAAGFAALGLFPGGAPDAPLTEPPALRAAPRPTAPPAARPLSVAPPASAEPAAEQEPIDADETPAAAAVPTANRIDGLIAAGFSRDRATEILRRETELRQAAYAEEYRATGTVRPLGSTARSSAAAGLRAELGDGDYERYLEGTGQPHGVIVRAVEAESAAAHAGLLPGDEIRTYAGERVFNQRDLNALAQAGTPGEIVAATVIRDGQTLQLYVTRGPLGLL